MNYLANETKKLIWTRCNLDMVHIRKKYVWSGKFMEGLRWKRGIVIYLEARAFQYECRNQKDNASFSFSLLPGLSLSFSSSSLFLVSPLSGNPRWVTVGCPQSLVPVIQTVPARKSPCPVWVCQAKAGRWDLRSSPLFCSLSLPHSQTSVLSALSVRNTVIKRSHWNFEFHMD